MVRLLLEYACQVLHPHLSIDIEKLENVQKLALCLCTKQWSLDYDMLLSTCNLPTLAARRKFFCLCTMFKIVHKMVHFPRNIIEPRVTPLHPSSALLFSQPFVHTNSFLYSFVPLKCHVWNSLLPLPIRLSDSISTFKNSVIDWLYHNLVIFSMVFMLTF